MEQTAPEPAQESAQPTPLLPKNCAWLYIMQRDGHCKVGYTRDLGNRLSQVRNGAPSPVSIHLAVQVPLGLVKDIEARAHYALSWVRASGEWFKCDGESAEEAVGGAIAHVMMKSAHRPRSLTPTTPKAG